MPWKNGGAVLRRGLARIRAPGRPLRVVLLTFYNYESHALRIFHPLLKQRGHDVHSIFFKNYFTYQVPTQTEEDMVVDWSSA